MLGGVRVLTVRDGERWNIECLVGLGFSHSKRWREVER